MEGWISLHRKFINWEWYEDLNTKSLFIHCLLKANHKDKDWRGKKINKGQFFTSISHLSNDLGLSEKQIRLSLKKLEKTGEIEYKGASKGTMITICKYVDYQGEEKQKGKQKDEPRANEGQTEGEQRATTNNDNKEDNVNNDNKIDIPSPEKGEVPPLKINLKSLLEKKIKLKDLTEEIIESIERANDKKYIRTVLSFWELFKKHTKDLNLPTKEIDQADIYWADEIRKLHSIDGYFLKDFEDMYSFLQESDFWKDKVLSVMAFRKRRTSKKNEPKNPMKIQNIMTQVRSSATKKPMTTAEAYIQNEKDNEMYKNAGTLGDLEIPNS